jgi:cytidylate kinase
MTPIIIAIDGPSGAGKGTVARAIAGRLGYPHIDTGAMYRAVAWKAAHDGVALNDEAAIASIAARARFAIDGLRVSIDGHDVTSEIRTAPIDAAAAAVARMPAVREALVARQRGYRQSGGLVMEGRDIGTVVFPDAELKIFLEASPAERATRRARDPAHDVSKRAAPAEVARALEARDEQDRTRQASPLVMAPDAVLVDTTGVSVDEVVRRVLELVEERLRRSSPSL